MPVGAAIVRVARALGQPVLVIAKQSYALTLYTLWQLQQIDRCDDFDRQLRERHGLGLLAFAIHEPKELPKMHREFLAEHTARPDPAVVGPRAMSLAARARAIAEWVPASIPPDNTAGGA